MLPISKLPHFLAVCFCRVTHAFSIWFLQNGCVSWDNRASKQAAKLLTSHWDGLLCTHWCHTTASVLKPDPGDSAKLGYCKTCIRSSAMGVTSERLSWTAAAFSEFPVGIIQVAEIGPRDKIGTDRFAGLKAILFSQKLYFDPATEVHCVFPMWVCNSYICKAATLPSLVNASLWWQGRF